MCNRSHPSSSLRLRRDIMITHLLCYFDKGPLQLLPFRSVQDAEFYYHLNVENTFFVHRKNCNLTGFNNK